MPARAEHAGDLLARVRIKDSHRGFLRAGIPYGQEDRALVVDSIFRTDVERRCAGTNAALEGPREAVRTIDGQVVRAGDRPGSRQRLAGLDRVVTDRIGGAARADLEYRAGLAGVDEEQFKPTAGS